MDEVMTADEQAYWDELEAEREPTPAAFCDNYTAHEPHGYFALNRSFYACPGITEQELTDLDAYEASVGTCEHGMRADRCGGPMHWYDPS
ncbi:MAG TPA: hypothetical protein VFT75_18380 [Nocardioidaceae bacterium]|nr:hypothetical protein [Nocardioidaceae bacterium]